MLLRQNLSHPGLIPQATKRIAFTVAVIALSAKMAKADGVVTHNEINAFRARVHIPPAEVKQVGQFWDLARQTPNGFEDYANQVARYLHRAPRFLNNCLIYYSILRNQTATLPRPKYLILQQLLIFSDLIRLILTDYWPCINQMAPRLTKF